MHILRTPVSSRTIVHMVESPRHLHVVGDRAHPLKVLVILLAGLVFVVISFIPVHTGLLMNEPEYVTALLIWKWAMFGLAGMCVIAAAQAALKRRTSNRG